MCLVIGAYSADQGRLVLALSQPFPFSQSCPGALYLFSLFLGARIGHFGRLEVGQVVIPHLGFRNWLICVSGLALVSSLIAPILPT
jgi:hypothetical protein